MKPINKINVAMDAMRKPDARLMGELDAMINAPKPEPVPDFKTLYRNNQRSGLYYVEDSDE
jgi:hypothetical protein